MFGWVKFVRYLNWLTIQTTIACVIQRRLTGLAAEMAFHAMLGLFPGIIAVLTAISLFEKSVESTFISLAVHFAGIVPTQVWTLLLDFIESIKSAEGKNWFSLSSIAAVWIISGVLSAAMNALDEIHQVVSINRRSYVDTKVIAISLTILTIVFLVIACFLLWIGDFLLELAFQLSWNALFLSVWQAFSIIVIIAIATSSVGIVYQSQTKLRRQRDRRLKFKLIVATIIFNLVSIRLIYLTFAKIQDLIINANLGTTISNILIDLWRFLGFPIALGIIAIAFSLIYRYGASDRTKNTPIFPGAILAAVSWAIVSVIFRLYVTHIGIYSKIYGAVGTVVILMLWLYLSSLVMLIGEQVNLIVGQAMGEQSKLECDRSSEKLN